MFIKYVKFGFESMFLVYDIKIIFKGETNKYIFVDSNLIYSKTKL